MSSFRRAQSTRPQGTNQAPDSAQKAPCPHCGKLFLLYTNKGFGFNSKLHTKCLKCFWAHQRNNRVKDQSSSAKVAESSAIHAAGSMAQVSVINYSSQCNQYAILLDHYIFQKGEWPWIFLVILQHGTQGLHPMQHPAPPYLLLWTVVQCPTSGLFKSS